MVNDLKDKAKETADAIAKEGETGGQCGAACERGGDILGSSNGLPGLLVFPQPNTKVTREFLYQDFASCPLLFPRFFLHATFNTPFSQHIRTNDFLWWVQISENHIYLYSSTSL